MQKALKICRNKGCLFYYKRNSEKIQKTKRVQNVNNFKQKQIQLYFAAGKAGKRENRQWKKACEIARRRLCVVENRKKAVIMHKRCLFHFIQCIDLHKSAGQPLLF